MEPMESNELARKRAEQLLRKETESAPGDEEERVLTDEEAELLLSTVLGNSGLTIRSSQID